MAESIIIEIPVSVTDNTGPGTNSVTRHISAIEKAFEKMQSRVRSVQSLLGQEIEVRASVEDEATPILSRLEEETDRFMGTQANVELSADDNVTQVLRAASSAVESFDGESAQAEISADDGATQIVRAAEDAVSQFDGTSADAEVGVSDHATPVLAGIEDMVTRLDGSTATVNVNTSGTIGGRDSPLDTPDILPAAGIAGGLKGSIASAAGIFGVGIGVTNSINAFKGFEATMSEVQAISGAAGDEFAELSEKAMQMGADTKFSAVESAEAFKYMAMAGWKSQQMLDGIEGVMSLAASSGEDLGMTSSIVTGALTAFGMSASDAGHFSNVLAQASANANTNVGLLGESFKYVAPIAGTMGYSIEDTSLALGLMANAEIQGSMAGTALKTSIANMVSPTNAMASAMDKYGISLTDREGNMLGLKGVMDNLRTSLGSLSETEQTAAASTIFGKEAMSGMLAIINASEDDYNKLTNAVYNADGAAQRMSETMMDNLAGSFEYLGGAVDEVQTTLGQRLSPYLRGAADSLAEEMPGVKSKIEETMNWIDTKVAGMTASSEWANAGFLEKVNIAWDTLIAEPFMEWAGGPGKHMITTGISNLFSEAGKIFSGNGGLTSWLSAGIIAKGAVGTASGISKLVNALGGFGSVGGKIGLAGSAIAAGIGAVTVAIDNYNEKQINDSLEEHFGNIELSAQQISDFTDQFFDAEFGANIDLVLGDIRGVREAKLEAENVLEANKALEWKCSVGMLLSEDEQGSYIENVGTFLAAKKTELEKTFSGVSLAINTVVDESKSSHMIETVTEWFSQDEAQLASLSAKLSSEVENALADGIIGAKEQRAIAALQDKINGIFMSWDGAESRAMEDMIRLKYGHLTGSDLTSESFSAALSDYRLKAEAEEEKLLSVSSGFYNMAEGAYASHRLGDTEYTQWMKDWDEGVLNHRGSQVADLLGFANNTLNETYGSEITSNLEASAQAVTKNIQNQMNSLFNGGEFDIVTFQDYLHAGVSNQKGNGSGALKKLYSEYETEVEALGSMIDQWGEEFGYVPEGIRKKYDDAIRIGAAAGNESAAMQMYANSLLEQGGEQLVSALTNESNPLYGMISATSPELMQMIGRALIKNGHSVELEGLTARAKGEFGIENTEEAKAEVERALEDFQASITNSGSQLEVTAEGVQVTIGSATVDGQSAIEQIAAAVNMSADELAIANGYTSAVEVPVGAKVTIPPEAITFDTSAIENATQEASHGVTAPPVDVPADATVKAGTINSADARSELEKQTKSAMEEPIPAKSTVDDTLSIGDENIGDTYNTFAGSVRSTFATPITASSQVNVTLDWNLLNPSIGISTTNTGSSVTASIAAPHAEGGLFGSPHLGLVAEDGPEAIIPLGSKRRGRGLDLWAQAGEALGVKAYADGGIIGNVPVSTTVSANNNGDAININLTLNNAFTITGSSDGDMEALKHKLSGLVNDFAVDLAQRIRDVHSNTPVMV